MLIPWRLPPCAFTWLNICCPLSILSWSSGVWVKSFLPNPLFSSIPDLTLASFCCAACNKPDWSVKFLSAVFKLAASFFVFVNSSAASLNALPLCLSFGVCSKLKDCFSALFSASFSFAAIIPESWEPPLPNPVNLICFSAWVFLATSKALLSSAPYFALGDLCASLARKDDCCDFNPDNLSNSWRIWFCLFAKFSNPDMYACDCSVSFASMSLKAATSGSFISESNFSVAFPTSPPASANCFVNSSADTLPPTEFTTLSASGPVMPLSFNPALRASTICAEGSLPETGLAAELANISGNIWDAVFTAFPWALKLWP